MGVFVCGDSGGGSSRWAMGRHEQFVHWSNIAHAMSGEQLYVRTYTRLTVGNGMMSTCIVLYMYICMYIKDINGRVQVYPVVYDRSCPSTN